MADAGYRRRLATTSTPALSTATGSRTVPRLAEGIGYALLCTRLTPIDTAGHLPTADHHRGAAHGRHAPRHGCDDRPSAPPAEADAPSSRSGTADTPRQDVVATA